MAKPPYKNAGLPVEQRVDDLLRRMTLEEKVAMLSGAFDVLVGASSRDIRLKGTFRLEK